MIDKDDCISYLLLLKLVVKYLLSVFFGRNTLKGNAKPPLWTSLNPSFEYGVFPFRAHIFKGNTM